MLNTSPHLSDDNNDHTVGHILSVEQPKVCLIVKRPECLADLSCNDSVDAGTRGVEDAHP